MRKFPIVAVAAVIACWFAWSAVSAYRKVAPSGAENVRLEIGSEAGSVASGTAWSADASAATVSRALVAAGVFDSWTGFVFPVASALRGEDKLLHPGTFFLPRGAGVREAVLILKRHARDEVTVTIPEGTDLEGLAKILMKSGLLSSPEDLYAVTGEPAKFGQEPAFTSEDFPWLEEKPAGVSLEGYLFPDTYRFFADSSPREIVDRMLANFGARTADLRAEVGAAGKDFHDVVTLASVVEAEVRGSADRKIVADLFLRRIAEGMGLQADSTVNYATGAEGLYTSAADRGSESPWNTYKHRGLPPGAIGNPGLDAIAAVVHPQANGYVYFLTAPDGTVHYARTLEEHNANKRYLD